jgi:D12 class N6 adenine-specific DNA methyltransferase
MNKTKPDLTFRYNLKQGRHGWLRLTPAYSVRIVEDILNQHTDIHYVLDPFSGTGTTGLVCATHGRSCTLVDINPFLVWLAEVKTRNYSTTTLETIKKVAGHVVMLAQADNTIGEYWQPPIHDIDRWWSRERIHTLSKLFHFINGVEEAQQLKDLLLLAFCRLSIQWSNAAFNHQSMSFKSSHQLQFDFDETDDIMQSYRSILGDMLRAAAEPLPAAVSVCLQDSRTLDQIHGQMFDAVITSPPYPNRMSYIRELRPYMYWLGYLQEARQAGELDWQAIGGTWGIATSRLQTWAAQVDRQKLERLEEIVKRISLHSPLLANYVHKYFEDVSLHLGNLRAVLKPSAKLFYIVGNSKFYDTLVPVEQLYAELFAQHGYSNVQIETIRKRNSKKELFEYVVSCVN